MAEYTTPRYFGSEYSPDDSFSECRPDAIFPSKISFAISGCPDSGYYRGQLRSLFASDRRSEVSCFDALFPFCGTTAMKFIQDDIIRWYFDVVRSSMTAVGHELMLSNFHSEVLQLCLIDIVYQRARNFSDGCSFASALNAIRFPSVPVGWMIKLPFFPLKHGGN